MNRKLLATVSATALFCGQLGVGVVHAADLSVGAGPPAFPPVAIAGPTDWNGVYFGGALGAGYLDALVAPDSDDDRGEAGVLAGLTLGVNFQHSMGALWGIEADVSIADLQPGLGGSHHILTADFVSSIRGRLGVVRGDNLIFATAGAGFLTGMSDSSDGDAFTNFTKVRAVVGGGVERMVSENLSVKVEGLAFLGSDKFSGPSEPDTMKNLYMFRTGINFHF